MKWFFLASIYLKSGNAKQEEAFPKSWHTDKPVGVKWDKKSEQN